ncbi:GNAT family N-acetyltransferase [Ichthyenterobacterium magnum]|uniref:Acetyltransferase (GNAT) family protein n=1 Tax=Ichthyenterobacterium magnum TaxID=1230530 RepID=A0A420DM68_9FLAO|nr:GNAT family N-acetyltransferase [Ichthyenterobacterium magnum]RKE95301.1 acetyltransferase (GNAT) family protein [Ichthyenterobacterium magnum]
MLDNPFTSKTYTSIWTKHFNEEKPPIHFKFIKNVQFYKHKLLPFYVNIGKNLTKGIDYKLNVSADDYKGKVFFIYDVPTYFNLEEFKVTNNSSLRLKKLFQYQGFLMDISTFENQDDYINAQFSSKNRREFKSNKRRLETSFNIKYSFIHGSISKPEFDLLFKQFYDLLNKRFQGKQTNYHHLKGVKWNFYKVLVFEMLLEKKASMLVIYSDKNPIGITLNFHAKDVLFETITVFDPDYYKFSIGKTSIIKLLEWCFENNYKISDFSKGDFDYKRKWSNHSYNFDYHVLYDVNSIKARLIAKFSITFFKIKLYLRKKKVNNLYRKYLFKIKGGKAVSKHNSNYITEKLPNFTLSNAFKLIDYNKNDYRFLLEPIYTFLFASQEPLSNIKVYQNKLKSNVYIISGTKGSTKIEFN